MAGKRKIHTPPFKARVALAAHEGDRTVNELARQLDVHPTLIHTWKKQLLAGAEEIFAGGAKAASDDAEARQAELFEQIGRLKMELEWLKKKLPSSCEHKRSLIDVGHPALSVRRQCELLGLSRSSFSYEPAGETPENLRLMRLIDEQYTARPFYGSRRMTRWLVEQGEEVNRKRVQRLMRTMGLEAIYPKPRLSQAGTGHKIDPYLLRGAGRPGLEHRHHLCADGLGVHVPGGGDRLVQPVRDHLAAVEHARRVVLPGDARRGLEVGEAGGLQHRPGGAVHGGGVHRLPGGGRSGGEHGRPGAGVGQRVRGAAVEEREIRGHLHSRLRGGAGAAPGAGPVLRLLQQRTSSSVAGISNPGGSLPGGQGHEGLTGE
jgi:transposase-like protein